MKGTCGSKLYPEMNALVKQWLYRMWSRCAAPKDVYRNFAKILKWRELVGSFEEECPKLAQNEVVPSRILKGQKMRPKHKTLKQHRRNEHAMVGKAGGILAAAYPVVGSSCWLFLVTSVKWRQAWINRKWICFCCSAIAVHIQTSHLV